MKTSWLIILAIILVSFVIGICLYPQMPEKFASHWGAAGEVNGYMPKFWGLFLMPVLSVVLFLLFIAIPKIDPLKANIQQFRKYYDMFIVVMMAFMFYIYLLTIFWNFGFEFNMMQFMVPALALLFYYCGVLVENSKMNWFIGIRTPWTLSSEKVWEKTHRLGGKLFKAVAVVSLIGLFFGQYAIYFVLAPVIAVAVYTVVYSYIEFQKEKK